MNLLPPSVALLKTTSGFNELFCNRPEGVASLCNPSRGVTNLPAHRTFELARVYQTVPVTHGGWERFHANG